ncbi:hypothetical protein BP5796_00146 [Coleophoma crateriformis]|uniref:Uncharacterized protein n=1 Tax=Coleophoma crateriformis TaxID=565419 RepID=A0A3D8T750_9HELO|nr:hypothetical protein BP5796_00146 [Coleophoma crateriformis]
MWKRLQAPKRRPAIGEPVLLETTLDESTYGSSSTGFGIKQRPIPLRGESDDTLTSLPHSNMDPTESHASTALRNSHFRPASSIYSQPSPESGGRFPRYSYKNPQGISYDEEEVSPPSSPEYETFAVKPSQLHYIDEEEVSPVDQMPDVAQLEVGRPESRPGSSNIPNLRRERRKNQAAIAAAELQSRKTSGQADFGRLKPTGDTRFDKYTGEPTTSDKGGRLGVKPGHFQPPALRSVGNSTKVEASVTAAPKVQTSFSDRLKKLGKNAVQSTTQRSEEKGSSGRTPVSPMHNQFDQAPLSISSKSSQRVDTPPITPIGSPVSAVRSGVSETVAVPASMPANTDPAFNAVSLKSGSQDAQMTTLTKSDAPEPISKASATSQNSSIPSRLPDRGERTQTRDTVRTEVPSTSNNNQTKSTDAIERNFKEAIKEVATPEESHLSAGTYAQSTHPSYDSERTTLQTSQALYEQSILNRRRPRIMESPKTIARKQVGSGTHFNPNSPIFISMREGRRSSVQSSIGKNLPVTPAEAASRDLITSLQAQIDDSAHRLRNIQRSIRQMTELMPTDHVLLTDEVKRKREMEKIKIEKLKQEEADVRRLEHDLGLRLHRAYKRRDKDAVYEPTAFWVRRATG